MQWIKLTDRMPNPDEHSRVTEALKNANMQAEHFERESA